MLEVKNIFYSYQSKQILRDVSFRLERGKIGTLIGPSGTGKTTLLHLLTGVLKLQKGSISITDEGKASYLLQQDMLLPWRTVIKNLTLLSEFRNEQGNEKIALEEAEALLEEMDLSNHKHKYPDELSGGMRQRVALARALLQKHPLLLLDEPFNSLDVCLRQQMYQLLREIQSKFGTTILLVTHDFRDALSLSDQIFLMAEGTMVREWHLSETMRNDPHTCGLLQRELGSALASY